VSFELILHVGETPRMSMMDWGLKGARMYLLAGFGHLLRPKRNFKEQIALISDLAIFVLLAVFVASRMI
jgi:hypothetical protein